MTGLHRFQRASRKLLVPGVVVPVVCLLAIFLVSEATGIVAGNVVFVLTIVTSVLWVVVAGWGRRMRAASPLNELAFGSGSRYARDVGSGSPESELGLPVRLLVVLSGIVLWGWVVLLVDLLVFGWLG